MYCKLKEKKDGYFVEIQIIE